MTAPREPQPYTAEEMKKIERLLKIDSAAWTYDGDPRPTVRRLLATAFAYRVDARRLDWLEEHGKKWSLPDYIVTVADRGYWKAFGADEDGATVNGDTLRAAIDAASRSPNDAKQEDSE